MTAINTIVVAVDFSDIVADVIRTACAVADRVQTRMHVITVVPDPVRQAWSSEVPGLDFEGIHQQWQEEARGRLIDVLPLVTLDAAKVSHSVLTGVPDREIVRYAKDYDADLIVVGTHGYGPFKRLILGSVADRVIRQALCAVLIVPPSAHHGRDVHDVKSQT